MSSHPNPFFTVIIPTLNEEKRLPLLLSDLVHQNFTDYNIILVDGFSTDDTLKQANLFQNNFSLPITIIQTKIRNPDYQRTYASKKATGTYLIFLDADTRIPFNYLQAIYQKLQKSSPDILTTWINPDTKHPVDKLIATITNLLTEASRLTAPAAISSHLVVKNSTFKKAGGFDHTIKFGPDVVLTRKITKGGGKYVLLKSPRAIFSFRRFEREGRLKGLYYYLLLHFHLNFRDPHTPPPVTYPMGETSEKIKLTKKPHFF